jgi:hypothetical protein
MRTFPVYFRQSERLNRVTGVNAGYGTSYSKSSLIDAIGVGFIATLLIIMVAYMFLQVIANGTTVLRARAWVALTHTALKGTKIVMAKAKDKRKGLQKVPVNVLIEPQQKAALEQLGLEQRRPVGFLVREAIDHYLASLKKKG